MSTPALVEKGSPGSAPTGSGAGSANCRYAAAETVTLEELRIDNGTEKKVCCHY